MCHTAPTALLLAELPLGDPVPSPAAAPPHIYLTPQPQLSRHLGLKAGSTSFARLAELNVGLRTEHQVTATMVLVGLAV